MVIFKYSSLKIHILSRFFWSPPLFSPVQTSNSSASPSPLTYCHQAPRSLVWPCPRLTSRSPQEKQEIRAFFKWFSTILWSHTHPAVTPLVLNQRAAAHIWAMDTTRRDAKKKQFTILQRRIDYHCHPWDDKLRYSFPPLGGSQTFVRQMIEPIVLLQFQLQIRNSTKKHYFYFPSKPQHVTIHVKGERWKFWSIFVLLLSHCNTDAICVNT